MKIAILDGKMLNPGDVDWSPISALGETVIYDTTSAAELRSHAAGADVLLLNKVPLRKSSLKDIPANVEVGQMVPQLDILSQASVFITHAGMGGTGEAIYYGVPMIAIPQMEEQAITARQIEKLGLGCAFLDKNAITSESLKAAIVKLLTEPSYRATALDFSQDMKSLGGATASADAVMRFLAH